MTPATNKGLASTLADGIKSAFVRCSPAVRLKIHCSAFDEFAGCFYLRLWVRYVADVWAKRSLNASAAASPKRYLQALATLEL